MYALIRYTLLVAKRDYVIIGVLLTCVAALLVSYFLGSTAIMEQEQMTIAYLASANRAVTIVGVSLFVAFFIRRAFEQKEIEWLLARPLPRWQCLVGFALGIGIVVLCLCTPIALLMWWLAAYHYQLTSSFSVVCWALSLAGECWLIACFTLAASVILQSAVVASLTSLAFYAASRMMGFMVGVMHHYSTLTNIDAWSKWFFEHVAHIISVALPRLDLFTKSDWLIYSMHDLHMLWFLSLQVVIYTSLVLAMAVLDFNRKEF